MAIEVTCRCGKTLSAPDGAAGMEARCPECGQALVFPGGAGVPQEEGKGGKRKKKRRSLFEIRSPRCKQCGSKKTVWLYQGHPIALFLAKTLLPVANVGYIMWMMGCGFCATGIGCVFGLPLIALGMLVTIPAFLLWAITKPVMLLAVPYECQACGHVKGK